MQEYLLTQLCSLYSLGVPSAPPERISGGLVHRMYRVRTPHGHFAIKLLSEDTRADPTARDRFRQGEEIAAAVAAAGLPAVAALEAAGERVQSIDSEAALVYPWIEGQTLSSSSAGPQRACLIGTLLGQMHRLPLHGAAPAPPLTQTFATSDWAQLVEQAEGNATDWSKTLRAALPDLERWEQSYVQAQQALGDRWVLSHGDLHQQNVLWTDDATPWWIDWENAGWQQPAKEALVCALEWSGFVEGEPDLFTFHAFLQGYRRECLLNTQDALHGLDACFGNWLGWLRFCTQRALGLLTQDPQERAEGARQVVGTLATVRRVESDLPALYRACQE